MMDTQYNASTLDEKELWNENGRYKRYWAHHKQMSLWMKQYVKNHDMQLQRLTNLSNSRKLHTPYYGCHGDPYQQMNNQWIMQNHNYHGYPSQQSPWYQPEHYMASEEEAAESMNYDLNGADSDDSFEMEISDELRHFFAVSAKFREERRKAKELEDSQDKSAHSGSTLKRSTAPPTERPGQRRLKEMQELYGKHAAMIHGMETALQLQFDRACDKKQPSYWPIIPLNV